MRLHKCSSYRLLWFCYIVNGIPWSSSLNTAKNLPARQVVIETSHTTSLQASTITPPATLASAVDDPPEVCGYGSPTWRWACAPYSTCLWRTDLRAVGCCRDETNVNTCDFHTSCVEYQSQQSCTGPCSSNSLILRCTDSATPYCAPAYFGPKMDYFAFYCVTASWHWIIGYSSIDSANVTSTMTNVPRYVGGPSSQFSTITGPSSVPSPEPTSQGPSPNIGTIVGGSVGGFLALCIMAVVITVIIVRNKRKAGDQTVSSQPPAPNPPDMQLYGAAYWNEMDGQATRKAQVPRSQEQRAELSSYRI